MLARENNKLVCRVGPDTAMGKAPRRYWLPVLQTSDCHRRIATLFRSKS
jgi:phthalate 4,5-dioxygenase